MSVFASKPHAAARPIWGNPLWKLCVSWRGAKVGYSYIALRNYHT